MLQLFVEAFIVGIVLILIAYFVNFIIYKLYNTNLPKICKKWNKNHIMEISLFFIGVFTHFFFEFTGLNKWYCSKGFACKR